MRDLWIAAFALVVIGASVLAWASFSRAASVLPVAVGQEAPDFTLMDQTGLPITLSDFRGDKNLVLYFYPKDSTPGCTKQACSFRDDLARFEALNTRVLGISVDGVESHGKFAKRNKLTFPILSDKDHRVSEAYGVLNSFAGFSFAKRTTFVIDPRGVIRRIYTDVDPKDHTLELLRYLREPLAVTVSGE